ncbi:MAG TPA: hypothetical protein VJN18_05490 [Polyangiaceae bacterium]|nr:hypothetical protein [Polyangiaceae bacterium]
MKSVFGLLGFSVLVFSCGGDGNAVFDPVSGSGPGSGSSGSMSTSGSGGNVTSGDGAGGSSSGSGGQSTSGNGGTGNDGGGGSGPGIPEVIFVATSGNDDAQCGLTPDTACKSISQGAARAVEAGRPDVYVQAGTYPGVAVLKPGVHIIGGFDTAWQTGARTDDAHKVVIEGSLHDATQEYLAVWAHDLGVEASLENLLVSAPTAQGQKGGSLDGKSSYGVHAVNAKLTLRNVDITGASGADGADGDAGQNAEVLTATDGMNGEVGGTGLVANQGCNAEGSLGGEPGVNSCNSSASARAMTGGRGGNGGARSARAGSRQGRLARSGDASGAARQGSGVVGKGDRQARAGKRAAPGARGGRNAHHVLERAHRADLGFCAGGLVGGGLG